MESWIVWLIVAAVLGVFELMTTTLALGIIAVAAAVGAATGALNLPLPVQVGAFVAASAAGLAFVRPVAMRHIKQPPVLRTGAAAIVGKSAIVTEEITGFTGRIKVGGEEWTSRCYDETLVIPVGRTVDILQIEGATALVFPRE